MSRRTPSARRIAEGGDLSSHTWSLNVPSCAKKGEELSLAERQWCAYEAWSTLAEAQLKDQFEQCADIQEPYKRGVCFTKLYWRAATMCAVVADDKAQSGCFAKLLKYAAWHFEDGKKR